MIDSTGKRVMNMWIILAFASALFVGITAILAKVGVKRPIQCWQLPSEQSLYSSFHG